MISRLASDNMLGSQNTRDVCCAPNPMVDVAFELIRAAGLAIWAMTGAGGVTFGLRYFYRFACFVLPSSIGTRLE